MASQLRGRHVISEPHVAVELSVSDFVAVFNQTLETAYPNVVISGELANFRVSRNRWVYFDLKDDLASVKFFGTVYMLPGPLEDGMLLKVRGQPRLHPLYGFSVNIISMQPTGEGSIRKAAELLQAKLAAEGLFDPSRKRFLPYPPARIGLITAKQSAAYADFIKVFNARWQGVDVQLIDVQVQGEAAPAQIVQAIEQFNGLSVPPDVLVLIRGGGSAEDLAAFSTEQVTRAVAASRVPTLVAIGHEVNLSLAELAADQRASTPSNAAELLVPDRREISRQLDETKQRLQMHAQSAIQAASGLLAERVGDLYQLMENFLNMRRQKIELARQLLAAYNPEAILQQGYAIVRLDGQAVKSAKQLQPGQLLDIQLHDGARRAQVTDKP